METHSKVLRFGFFAANMILFWNAQNEDFGNSKITLRQHGLIFYKLQRCIHWRLTRRQALTYINVKIFGVVAILVEYLRPVQSLKFQFFWASCIWVPSLTWSIAVNYYWSKGATVRQFINYLQKTKCVYYLEAVHDVQDVVQRALKLLKEKKFEQFRKLEHYFTSLLAKYFKSLPTLNISDKTLPHYLKNFINVLQMCDTAFATLHNIVIHKSLNCLQKDLIGLVCNYMYAYENATQSIDFTLLNFKILKSPQLLFNQCSQLLSDCEVCFIDIYKMLDDDQSF